MNLRESVKNLSDAMTRIQRITGDTVDVPIEKEKAVKTFKQHAEAPSGTGWL